MDPIEKLPKSQQIDVGTDGAASNVSKADQSGKRNFGNRKFFPMKRRWLARCLAMTSGLFAVGFATSAVYAGSPSFDSGSVQGAPVFLSYAQFQIPFTISRSTSDPALVQLWVSTDEGVSWQMHGSVKPNAKFFEFRAAAEGEYLFKVHTIDTGGASHESPGEPLRVCIDTTKPQAAVRADINSEGKLVVDIRVVDRFINLSTAALRVRSDRDSQWREIPVQELLPVNDLYEGKVVVDMQPCREVGVVFAIQDLASNSGEATFRFDMPRTANGEKDMRLASTGSSYVPTGSASQQSRIPDMPGAVPWNPSAPTSAKQGNFPSTEMVPLGPGQLASSSGGLQLESRFEELPPPTEAGNQSPALSDNPTTSSPRSNGPTTFESNVAGFTNAYHCKSRAFSLDYSVEALGGSALADVELWGTEDNGHNWVLWGSDPDRQSPFDIQVGNDGLFGYRMVIVSASGIVSNRPRNGDSADVWINVDTSSPSAKIARAVYGEGAEDGMLVIDYTCYDNHLPDKPITLSYSERLDGPWTTIATGLKNTGMYLWKVDPNVPERIYIQLEVVDKAGNLAKHRLDLPIDVKGLSPRGRIQGFRPIELP